MPRKRRSPTGVNGDRANNQGMDGIMRYIVALLIFLVFAGYVIGVIIFSLYLMRDRTRHPHERIEAVLEVIFEGLDWLFYGLLDRIIGTRHEVISKRKMKRMLPK